MNKDALLRAVRLALDDEWDASHRIAQDYSDTTANWLHAVLHKIEGDEWNSRYWYARTSGRNYEDFADAGEKVYDVGGIASYSTTFGFVIPTAQPVGNYTIRIRINKDDNVLPIDPNAISTFDECQNISSFSIAPENTLYSYSNGLLIDVSSAMIKRCIVSKSGSVLISSDITSIDNSAFSNCTLLTSINIPESVISIGNRAFNDCKKLTDLYVASSTPIDMASSKSAFTGIVLEDCILHVPTGSILAYQNAAGWSNFLNIEEN